MFFGGINMPEQDKSKQIQETINKTYAYFNVVLSSLLSANFLLFGYEFLYVLGDYLTYHGIDEPGGKSHNIDLKTVIKICMISLVTLLMVIFFVNNWLRKIKVLTQKISTVVISLILYILLLPIFIYISLLFYSL